MYKCNVSADEVHDAIYKEYASIEATIRYTVPTLFGILFILGTTGNILVLKVLVSHKHMQNTTNILLGSLAFTDLFFILLCVPFTGTQYATSQWIFGRVWCKLVQYFIHVTAFASIWTLVLISFARYRAVIHPIANLKMRNRRNTYISLGIIWIVILAGNIPVLFTYDVHEYYYFIDYRTTCYHLETELNQIFFTCFFVFGYALPLGLICPLYGRILRKLIHDNKPGDYQSSMIIRSKLRVSRMICIVIMAFASCWLPIDLVLLIQSFVEVPQTNAMVAITVTANCLAYISSCVNPILYGFLSRNFRRSYRNLLCCFVTASSKVRFEMRTSRPVTPEKWNNTSTTRVDRAVTLA